MLLTPIPTNTIDKSYLQFMQQTVIRHFIAGGGKVYAATEGQSRGNIERLLSLGHRHFSEKYLQEAAIKYPDLLRKYPDIRLSYFGKLQTNKIKKIIDQFHTIESVSRPREATFIKNYIECHPGKTAEFFVQWNIGEEMQKNGASADNLPRLLHHCATVGLPITGLMVIPPKVIDPSPYFRATRTMADHYHLSKCQMGFSADYEKAIRCGATRIRISRLFFGRL